MKTQLSAICLAIALFFSPWETARADIFGGDVAVLSQILVNALQQLAQLRQILHTGSDTFGLLAEVNRGINDSLQMADTLGLRVDLGLYRDLGRIDQAVHSVEKIYGRAVNSPLATIQRNTDQTVAEAITFNNDLNEYARRLDRVGEDIKSYSHAVSPGGAAKLTAESIGVMIHVMNQQIRASGQALKLQAQGLALTNKEEKDRTAQYLHEGEALQKKMESINAEFNVPRF